MLPFIQPPAAPQMVQVGDATTGVLEIERRGGLTVEESDYVAEVEASAPPTFVVAARAADAIAKTEDISLSEAFAIVEGSVTGVGLDEAADEIRLRHAASVAAVAQSLAAGGRLRMQATVTAMLRFRCGVAGWDLNQTRAMPQKLLEAVWEFAQAEIQGEAMPAAEVTEEELGKPLPASGSRRGRTGKASAGS